MPEITAPLLLRAYAHGVFPMAESAEDGDIYWVDPDMRGVLPLDAVHFPRSLRKTLRRAPFKIAVDRDFPGVVAACAEATPDRPQTWINAQIQSLYGDLHRMGYAHSVECWTGDALVGGRYGVRVGAAFFGESMFSRTTDASKVALAHLVARLRAGGFTLLDTQFTTEHLRRFGAVEIPRTAYRAQLADAVVRPAAFAAETPDAEIAAIIAGG